MSDAAARAALRCARSTTSLWEIPADARPDMRVPARVFADARAARADRAPTARWSSCRTSPRCPGIREAALAMPDIHQGYGFPVGGVAATEPPDGVVSPGRRRLRHQLRRAAARAAADRRRAGRAHRAARPRDLAPRARRRRPRRRAAARRRRARPRARRRAARAVWPSTASARAEDLEHTESEGCLPGADPAAVSERARTRGADQLGTLGSGNHFLEVQRVDGDLRRAGRRGVRPARRAR